MKQMLTIVYPQCEDSRRTKRLEKLLEEIYGLYECTVIRRLEDFHSLEGKRLLFAIPLGISGINLEYFRYLKYMRLHPDMLKGCVGSILVDGESELYTKSVARELMFTANACGCAFPGRGMVEGTGSLQNFNIQAMQQDLDNMGAYQASAKRLVAQLMDFTPNPKKETNILVLHASNHKTSNTSMLWDMIKKDLHHCKITEISLRNGTVHDCSGCPFKMCMHFSEKSSCYYGGVIVEQVYPAIEACDAVVLLCPNYNDALSANLTAFINRLTALFRKNQFYEKSIFALVVSGYSGGNIVAEQVISAMSMNKTFRLPPYFAMLETANNPASILEVEDIQKKASAFAENMMKALVKKS